MESRIFPVRVLDSKGKLKRIISKKDLSERHWDRFKQLNKALRTGQGNNFLYGTTRPPIVFLLIDIVIS